jgi:ornithine cyclodeaminase/alanine dehydrogenase-like protein (mu-crystallin family)
MYLDHEQIKKIISYDALVPEMRRALIEFSAGRVAQPLRTILAVPQYHGRFAVMPAVYGEVMGTKMVSVYPGNASHNLPTHSSEIHLFSAVTGQSLAILHGDLITEMRTAAVSSIATDLLSPPNARVLAILGAGTQARAHATALRRVRSFDEVYVWSRNPTAAQNFAREIGGKAATIEETVRHADIIVTATSASQPILRGDLMKQKALIVAVGAVGPGLRELDDAAMTGTLIVESGEAALHESGDVILSGATVYAELGELLSGTRSLPKTDRIIYKSLGIAVEDVATANLIFKLFSAAL